MDLQLTIRNCLAQNSREQKALYQQYYGYSLKVVFRYIFHYDTAVDVVNDGWVKVFRNLERFHPEPGVNVEMMFMGWLRTIMVNTAIDHLRKNNFLQEIGSLPEEVWQPEDPGARSDGALLYKELVKEIKKLPPAYRAVFNMYVIDGFSHQEIADQLGIAVGTSKSNLAKARMSLQKILKKNDSDLTYAICQ
ncbi:RNA polymerase sigma factor [Flaviaesturariibacter aridisoli]|uniref:RNA polymerase sigma factor n=1 Tax=Flaviaesturariibacter aridisoli TaxID=2545761 RepID=UPI001FB7A359|nr:RNA polymerase sigma factor [Flaviaesturariibacter aridisoli]